MAPALLRAHEPDKAEIRDHGDGERPTSSVPHLHDKLIEPRQHRLSPLHQPRKTRNRAKAGTGAAPGIWNCGHLPPICLATAEEEASSVRAPACSCVFAALPPSPSIRASLSAPDGAMLLTVRYLD
ncbi:hypothetical protein CDD83_6383 [Cordyceps sp. RAO-2017]|nr:hypothetical protein CDD83_6383 [Cordyceps sp. RAO-2017]